MKLSDHSLLSLRIAMTELGYQWRMDPADRSLRWEQINHWELFDSASGYDFQQINLHPVISCDGSLCTSDVACSVLVRPDLSLDGWMLTETYTGSGKEIDPRAYALEDLPTALRDWVKSLSSGEAPS